MKEDPAHIESQISDTVLILLPGCTDSRQPDHWTRKNPLIIAA